MFKRRNSSSTFRKDEKGGIAIIFGFATIAIVGLVALSVDGGRAVAGKNKASAALDSATLAVTKALLDSNPSDAELYEIASKFFAQNTNDGSDLLVTYDNIQLSVDRGTKTVRITADTHVPTTFGRIFGVDTIDFGTAATATFNVQDIELGMALDITGSMRGRKIADLRLAAKDLVEILIPDNSSLSDVRIALAPYAASVNAGALADAVTDGLSADGCVVERSTSDRYTDAMPDINNWIGAWQPPQADIDPFQGRSGYSCPNAAVVPLTNDKDALKRQIDGLRDGGWTAGQLGTAWAWYLISPQWAGILPGGSEPRPYGTRNLVKAVVLMTDGDFNTAWRNDTSPRQAMSLCDNMKDAGVIVYSVSFESPNHPTLLDCASIDPLTGDRLYYDAANGTQLREAFQDIAFKLSNLRLAR